MYGNNVMRSLVRIPSKCNWKSQPSEQKRQIDLSQKHGMIWASLNLCETDGPAEDLYGIFINKIRKQRGDEAASHVRG
jgi:hypothetical protein